MVRYIGKESGLDDPGLVGRSRVLLKYIGPSISHHVYPGFDVLIQKPHSCWHQDVSCQE